MEFHSGFNNSKWRLDFRTKFYMTMTISIIVLSGYLSKEHYYIALFIYFLPIILIIINKKIGVAIKSIVFMAIGVLLQNYLIHNDNIGFLRFLIMLIDGIALMILPMILMGYYTFLTPMSDVVKSLENMKVPSFIIIPISVMQRFFYSVREDSRIVYEALKIYGIKRSSVLKKPIRYMEFRLIPLLMVSSRSADDVAISAMIRGLSINGKRSSISNAKLRVQDYIWIVIMTALNVYSIKSIWG